MATKKKRTAAKVSTDKPPMTTPTGTQSTDDDDPLVKFRTEWLRAIASAWADPKTYRKDLLAGKIKVLPPEWDRLELVVHEQPDFVWLGDEWSWVTKATKTKPKAAASKKRTPFPPPDEDELEIYLPLNQTIPPADYGRALADYYARRPSLFSRRKEGKLLSVTTSALASFWSTTRTASVLFEEGDRIVYAGNGPAPQGLFPTHTNFSSFTVALMAALAKAWANTNFRSRLQEDPAGTLRTVRQYEIPWQMKIRIFDDNKPAWDAKNAKWDFGDDKARKERNNVLRMCLPSAPDEGIAQALALGAYNATGAEYPFTCCP